MATLHPDAMEFLRWFEPNVLLGSVECPLTDRHTAVVDLLKGEVVCYHHVDMRRWPLRTRIDARAQRTMEEQPNGATGYHKPRHRR